MWPPGDAGQIVRWWVLMHRDRPRGHPPASVDDADDARPVFILPTHAIAAQANDHKGQQKKGQTRQQRECRRVHLQAWAQILADSGPQDHEQDRKHIQQEGYLQHRPGGDIENDAVPHRGADVIEGLDLSLLAVTPGDVARSAGGSALARTAAGHFDPCRFGLYPGDDTFFRGHWMIRRPSRRLPHAVGSKSGRTASIGRLRTGPCFRRIQARVPCFGLGRRDPSKA